MVAMGSVDAIERDGIIWGDVGDQVRCCDPAYVASEHVVCSRALTYEYGQRAKALSFSHVLESARKIEDRRDPT